MLKIATDGGCWPNPGPGGWAWVDEHGNYQAGSFLHGTNNIAELTALKMALLAHPDVPIEIEFDSQYAAYSVTQWGPSWRSKGITGKANMELIYEIIDIVDARPASAVILWTHVRGHAGHPLNETADSLATRMTAIQGEHVESGITSILEPKPKPKPDRRPRKPKNPKAAPSESDPIVPGQCAHSGCDQTYQDHHWGHKKAQSQDWFMQKNGRSWCPQHVPSWVAKWRANKGRSS